MANKTVLKCLNCAHDSYSRRSPDRDIIQCTDCGSTDIIPQKELDVVADMAIKIAAGESLAEIPVFVILRSIHREGPMLKRRFRLNSVFNYEEMVYLAIMKRRVSSEAVRPALRPPRSSFSSAIVEKP